MFVPTSITSTFSVFFLIMLSLRPCFPENDQGLTQYARPTKLFIALGPIFFFYQMTLIMVTQIMTQKEIPQRFSLLFLFFH